MKTTLEELKLHGPCVEGWLKVFERGVPFEIAEIAEKMSWADMEWAIEEIVPPEIQAKICYDLCVWYFKRSGFPVEEIHLALRLLDYIKTGVSVMSYRQKKRVWGVSEFPPSISLISILERVALDVYDEEENVFECAFARICSVENRRANIHANTVDLDPLKKIALQLLRLY
jgi:hypothetical protein